MNRHDIVTNGMRSLRMLLLTVLLVMTQGAQADSGAWYFGSQYFKWSVVGDGEIEFSIPVMIWDSSSNDAVTWGYIYVTPGNEAETKLLYYAYDDSRDMKKPCKFQALADGDFKVTNTVDGTVSFTRNDGVKSWVLKVDDDDDDHHTAKIRWKVPYSWRGKTIGIRVNFRWDDRYKHEEPNYTLSSYACPPGADASLTLNDPMLAFDKSSAGKIMMPWFAQAKSLSDVRLRTVDAANGHVNIVQLNNDGKMSGYVNIPADRPYSSVQLSAKMVATDGQEVSERVSSSSIAVPMLHTPNLLTARLLPNGHVQLAWKVDLPEFDDIYDTDLFDIQRNLTGSTDPDDAAWTTIAQEPYVQNKVLYEVVDSELVSRYIGKAVTYRVRRQATAFWGWVPDAKYAQVQIPANLNIYGINSATCIRSSEWNDEVHKVDFSFDFGGPTTDGYGNILIRNVADWEAFAQRVANGETDLKAVMTSDIDLGDSQVMVGTDQHPFTGTFDGNGYALIVHYKNNLEWTAPFRFVGNGGFITSLTIDGEISSTAAYVGGLVGEADGVVNIRYCRVMATLSNTSTNDAVSSYVGGFVARGATKCDIRINYCLFDGQILAERGIVNGGFVAWSDKRVSISNSLFAPVKAVGRSDNRTFCTSDDLDLSNCYYTFNFDSRKEISIDGKTYLRIASEDDWNEFREKVKQNAGRQDVNAILETDIRVTQPVGQEASAPYRGIFLGNGHTIDAAIKAEGTSSVAPFMGVSGATIKNLHVTGTIVGGIHSAGLVGSAKEGSSNIIENVRVSATITVSGNSSNGPHAAGLMGHTTDKGSSIRMLNCLFDGSIISTSWNDSYAGAFLGWGDGTWIFEHNYECGDYVNVNHAGFCYRSTKPWGGSSTSYSIHNWSEMAGDDNRNAGRYSSEVLCKKLGDQWKIDAGVVVPIMATVSIGQGTDANGWTMEQLIEGLDATYWSNNGNAVVPRVNRYSKSIYGATVWDPRAKLQLRINMHGEHGVESKVVDLSGNKDAISKHRFTQELSRKCVEYSFDMLVRRGSSTLPIVGVEADSAVYTVTKTDQGDLANYRFMNGNRITKLEANKKQSSVELVWQTSGGDHDYFRVLRRNHTDLANAAWTDTIANNLNQLFYEDKNVLAQQAYDYRVESVWQCEGTHVDGATCWGECEPTGMIDGYVRMADGTAMAGVKMLCTPKGNIPGAKSQYETFTDEAGYFAFRGLPFQGTGSYEVTAQTTGDAGTFTPPNADGVASFSQRSNWVQSFNFYMDTYYVYSGNVFYRDTSIPVPGVTFLLDGKKMHDASQNAIETDTQGAFSLSIPKGAHSVQAVKEGHYFAADGYLINEDAREGEDNRQFNFDRNISSACIWDSTTVMLQGRVVGGDVQGSLPLGEGLSVNNLGDSIKIVMQLEGDNASYLIRKQGDDTVTSDSYDVNFGPSGNNTTHVDVTRHTLTIRPDAETGEYRLFIHPAKYKVIEVSAKGYTTLFQGGKVGETVDLSFKKRGDTCVYNRIYHAVPTVEVTQFNPGGEKFYGVKKLKSTDNIGNESWVNLVYYKKLSPTDSVLVYSFGYPVFMAESPYGFMLQACEKYYWNNDYSKRVDMVKLDERGKITIKNAMTTDSKKAEWECALDSTGGCSYIFTPDDVTFELENNQALKSMVINLQYDGNYYDVKPLNGKILQGYVMATRAKENGRKSIATGKPTLVDILRDPPGGQSTAYIEEGSKLSYGYAADLTATLGLNIKETAATGANTWSAVIPVGPGSMLNGMWGSTKTKTTMDLDIKTVFGTSWNYSYNIDISERIQTKSGVKWIGPKADLFIGTSNEIIFADALAVHVLPDSMYQIVKGHEGGVFTTKSGVNVKVPVGTVKVLAQGTDDTGKPVWLVRDEVTAVSHNVTSTFVHSQEYIENELLPDLIRMRNALLLAKGTDENKAKTLANSTGQATYISNVAENDVTYGFDYKIVYPDNDNKATDKVSALNQEVVTWMDFLSQNEQEKLSVSPADMVKRYDFDGGMGSIQYNETFTTTENLSRYLRYPGISDFGNLAGSVTGMIGNFVKGFMTISNPGSSVNVWERKTDENGQKTWVCNSVATDFEFKFTPIASAVFTDKYTYTKTNSKKVGFTLQASSKSNMTVEVYRTATEFTIKKGEEFYDLTIDMLDNVRSGKLGTSGLSYADYGQKVYSTFVFRTVAGMTSEPYEGARLTKWYQPGTVLDVATVPIDKPNIWIDEPVVSNVPFDEPARFVLHMANETDFPEQASPLFHYYLLSSSNPKGAKICVDGKVLSSGGEDILLSPAVTNGHTNVFTKEITVYPSTAFDYEDLTICLYDPEDPTRIFSQKFSAHFIPTAGKVKVTVPSNNWVVNTESPYDGTRKAWYMPVRIEGFDVNWPNFDHIELQYKLSTQGDKDWVSTCSYYADRELQAKASGVTDTIPANGVIVAPFYGETDPIEQYYDIRAVTFCRHAGGFLTGSSEVLSGIKDTRPPVPFGTPEPTNGILGIGDDIKIQFSEAIAGNYLRNINNFEVLGTLLSNDISTSTSLSFNGKSVAFTQGQRNLTGKSFTVDVMLNPAAEGRLMNFFSHGGEEKGLRYGVTADKKLTATVNGQTVVSDSIVKFNNALHQVAYVLDQTGEGMTLNFFDGSKPIGSKKLTGKYEATGSLILGADNTGIDNSYAGEMLEFRLWNRALSASNLDTYGRKKLTGYESGLLDYYPLNEGTEDWGYDKAPGSMDLMLVGTSWKRPAGIAVQLKGDKGLRLKADKFNCSELHDYTMMFWFSTRDSEATLLSNGEARVGQEGQINIGVKNDKLFVRSAGFERTIDALLNDGSWHHFAMTVSRSQNVANVYVDKKLVESFAADSLQGIMGDHIALGATYTDKNEAKSVMTGYIDEVGMFSSVLPVNLIRELSTHTPLGTMTAMMAYLDFGRSQKQDNNLQRLMPTGISLKRYIDSQGKIVERRDTLVEQQVIEEMANRETYAPMVSNAQLDNLSYSFVANGNELFVDITEPDFMVERTNIYVTVKDIPDLQGNLMASPLTLNLYVYRNPLRWDVKRIEQTVSYGSEYEFEATVKNLSGTTQNFHLEDLPVWISASQTVGTVGALDEVKITFRVSSYINIGYYNEQITLVGDGGMSEPLPVTLTVRGAEPDWVVSDELKQKNQTMMMVAQVKIDGVVSTSEDDLLAVFDEQQQPLGVAHVEVNDKGNANEALVWMTIYGYTKNGQSPQLFFRFFDASDGNVYSVTPEDGSIYTFQRDAIIGSASEPVELRNTYDYVQTLQLDKNWNWVSFNVVPQKGTTIGQFLNGMSRWEPGDKVTAVSGTTVVQYTCREDKTSPNGYKWDNEDQPANIDPTMMYTVFSMNPKTIYLEGDFAFEEMVVHKDWNRIGYLSPINLPIAQALADYTTQASEGDVVKSQEGFAIASMTSTGLVWKGSLQYMQAGKGYMLKRRSDKEASFYYPLYFDSRYGGSSSGQQKSPVHTVSTMNIVAATEGLDSQQGDRLVVYRGADRMAEATADSEQRYYLNIGSDETGGQPLTFAIERDGETIAMTGSTISYVPNKVLGTPDQPTVISFTSLDQMPHDGRWYTVGGVLMGGKKPTQSGVYIYNGRAVVIN